MRCHLGAWLPLFVAAACILDVHSQYVRQMCGVDDFVCSNNMCIESSRVCDRVFDCPDREDESGCECTQDEFRCVSDGACIANRKRCDNTTNCRDGSDELDCGHHACVETGKFRCGDGTCISILLRCDGFRDCRHDGSDEFDCPCTSDQWQCDQGNCIKRSKRCNGRVDCPSDRSDERNCVAHGYFKCSTGKVIPEILRCNRQYDCPPGDYSDEKNCPCGDDDFRCNNGHCIQAYKRCDRTHDCQDGSDELHCKYGTDCMAYQYKCTSGECVHAESICNGTQECADGSDEAKCSCKRGQFRCKDGSCINIVLRCDGHRNCRQGEDELNCGQTRCPPGSFTCPSGTRSCADRCDGIRECDNGEDEDDCEGEDECLQYCDGRCLKEDQICDGKPDCSDGTDESLCDNCDGPDDFRCNEGECLRASQKCNGIPECLDQSDELYCNETITATRDDCPDGHFRCRNGVCVNMEFICDGNRDCTDNSDEENCACRADEFRCDNGQCVPSYVKCDRQYDCRDGSDERAEICRVDYTTEYTYQSSTSPPVYTTSRLDEKYRGSAPPRPGNPNDPSNGDRNELDNPVTTQSPNGRYDPYGPNRAEPDPYGSNRPESNPYGSNEPATSRPDSDPYGANQPGYDPYGSNTPRPGSDPYGANRPSSGSNTPGPNQPDSDPYGANRPGYDPYGSNTPGPNRPGSDPYEENRPGSDTYGANRPDSDPYGSNQPGSDPYGSNTPGPNRPGSDPYGSNQPGSDTYGSNQAGSDTNGANRPSYDPYGSNTSGGNQPGSSQPGSDPYGVNRPDYDPFGSNTPGPNQPGSDPYGANRPDYDPYGSNTSGANQPGSNQPGSDPYGANRPDYDPYGSNTSGANQPGSNQPGSDPYGANRPDYDPYGSNTSGPNQPGSNQPGSDPYGANRPDYDPYGSNTPGPNQPGSDIYGASRPGSDSYGSNQPGSDPYASGSNRDSNSYNNGPSTTAPQYPQSGYDPSGARTGSARGESVACKRYEWRCENGPCINVSRRCDGHIDCPLDFSDEFDCPAGSPVTLDVKTYPKDETVRFGGDVVFRCRDEGPLRAAVRWIREGGRPLKPGSIDKNGRLELYQVTLGDSGVYICQTPKYLGYSGSEVRVTLSVSRPERPVSTFVPCKPYEATCGNGECIPKSAVCDTKVDCADRSDEDMCNYNGVCEPNQFQCENRKCVLKSWLCDSDDDCGDGSDERACPPSDPNAQCLPMEFACATQSQCIPKSFHCDRNNDCFDGSDETGCVPIYITKPPKPANVKLNPGETLMLSCQASGVPVPIISWRLNWGHVPPKCSWTNVGGVGNLTCPNMLPEDSGAYSCEAINNVGTTFATPDSIVFVSKTDLCPDGYFNSEARSQSECIRCFCFGKTTRCQSADLFTHNMPTPLGEGGTRLIGVALSNDGEVRTDPSITNHYYYQGLRNGATVTKLARNPEQEWLGNFHPFVSLPETYKGNQLMSYGGHIKYSVSFHTQSYAPEDNVPAIIVKGKYTTLFHLPREAPTSAKSMVEARFTPEYWLKSGPNGDLIPATREDIMMALDAIEMILLRADSNNAGVNITNFVMESAQNLNAGLGAASLVEECSCPEGYDGLSCQKCKPGYVHEKSGPWLGHCVRKPCPPGTYGDPSNGIACLPCPCPLTNKDNQFATTCSLGPDGSVTCDCFTGYEGKTCEKCAAGFEGNPLVIGDKCRVEPTNNCNPVGTRHEQNLECVCKDNVQGRYCDQCKNDSFYLSNDFRHGCALCFCSGETQQCMSSNLRRKTTEIRFNVPSVVEQVGVYTSAPAGRGNFRYTAPVETTLKPALGRGGIGLSGLDRSQPIVYYWSMPMSFAGDKVTSYGGYLRYTLDNMPSYVDPRLKNKAPDVQLISDNHLTFQYFGNLQSSYEGVLNVSVQLLEKGWQRSDGKEVPREHFLLALADVKAILIKATYSTDSIATPLYASIETADADGDGPAALHVEQCVCPQGYIGTSCEDCAPGYTRGIGGLYLAHCEPCQCNDHSTNCHPETGQCYECLDNTDGPHCELCKDGYERDGYDHCIAIDSPAACRCDPRGIEGPCDADGACHCKRHVEGENCDRCRAGTFGLDASNPDGCIPCYCSGATVDCQEANHYYRVALPAPIFGDNYGGYTIMDLEARTVINDQFVPVPDKSELMYIFSFPPDKELYWSLPVFPGNRVLSYGGSLSLRQEFKSDDVLESVSGNDVILVGDGVSVAWFNPNTLRSGESLSYQVPLREQGWTILNSAIPAGREEFMRVLKTLKRVLVKATLVESIISTSIADVSMDSAAEMFTPNAPIAKGIEVCMCPPGHQGTSCENCVAGYYRNNQDYCMPCPCNGHDCQMDSNDQVQCNCRPPYTGSDCSAIGGQAQMTTPRPPLPPSTVTIRITSPTITIQEVGSSVNFTCKAQSPLTSRLVISWAKADGNLPQGRTFVDQRTGLLQITNLQITDSGQYICQTNDGSSTGQASVTLKVPANRMVHPSVEIRPPVNEYYAGDRIELVCVATGSPQPTISWQRASRRPLPLGAQLYGEYLIIDNAREEDSGEYRCIGSNPVGSSDRTAVITVRPRPSRPVQDRLVVTPTSPVVNEGQSTRVVCTPQSTNVPTGTIDWVRQDGARFEPNVRSDNGVLYIDQAIMENQGIYICQTHGAEVSPVPVMLTVISTSTPSPKQAPEVAVNLKSKALKIPSGESGTVVCSPSGYPLPLIKWYKYQDEFGRGVSQRGDTLIINEATDTDAGYYVCEGLVDNQVVNNVYVYVEIEKREEPKVEIWPPGEQPVALGDTQFEFHCRVLAGIPVPDVMWSRAGGRTLSSHVEIKPNNILKFDKIEVNDEGEYICTGTNLVGSASASAVLKVRSPPEIVITPSNYLEVHEGDAVNLDCRAEGYPEPWVTIRGPDQREIVSQTRIASLRLSSAGKQDEGDYACVATNSAGTIEEAFLIRVENRGDGVDFGGSGDGEDNYSPPITSRPTQDNQRPSDMIVFEGQRELTIYCDVSGGYTPQWDRGDRQPLQRNARQEGPRLIIYNVSKSDSGQYVCSVYNYQTGEVQVAANTSVRVVGAPKITLRPPTQTVHPGHSPTVECVVEGDNILDITWKPTYKPFSSRVKVRDATLIFQQIEVEDAGKYECVARNEYANASATAEVIVVEESDVAASESHEHDQWVHAGDGVVLSCNVSGDGVTVKWTKDGRRIPSNVRMNRDGSLFIKLVQATHAGHYVCHIRGSRGRQTSNYINLHIEGAPDEALVRITQPRRQYRVGENVEVLCKSASRDVAVEWIRRDQQGNRQYVHSNTFGDGSMMYIVGVEESDGGVYQCTGRNRFGQVYTDSFNLEIVPGSAMSNPRDRNVSVKEYSANLRSEVGLPCNHDLEEPYTIQWRREYAALPAEVRSNQPILHIQSVTESDAGTYVCRVSNRRTTVEDKAILRVVGVIPRFDGGSWIALPTIKDAYRQFDIEISFKPQDSNGLIMYNSQNAGRDTDYLALELDEGVPRFILEVGSGPVVVMGDRPLTLNEWHTIRLNRIGSRVTMDVNNDGPFVKEMPDWELLELRQPLYIGGVPDYNQLPEKLAGTAGFSGCVSMLILNHDEKNIMMERLDQERIDSCDTCAGHQCQNGGVCQEARLERGYICLCNSGFAGQNCDRRGEACRPGLCGTGKCTDTGAGYKCACPVTHTGRNCEIRQQIEYPAFMGSAYLALKPPNTYRVLKMSMKVKAAAPVTDGIIMYCAESPRGHGGFTSLTVRNQRLEFRYDLGEGNPAVLVSNTTLPANEWTDVQVTRSGPTVSLSINMIHTYEQRLDSTRSLKLETPMFVGGVDENIVLNSNTGVSSGFMGCIKDLKTYGISVDIVNDPNIESSNLQECSSHPERGDIPADVETPCRCLNGGSCAADGSCYCPPDFTGYYCETRLPSSMVRPSDPCAVRPCRNGGTCRPDYSNMMNHTCDCPLGFAGASCQMQLDLYQSVGFNGNGYLELPANLISYDNLENEPAVIALRVNTIQDGVLAYQREALAPPDSGDYLLIRIERGHVVLEWDMGGGMTTLTVNSNSIDGRDTGFVTDGEMHRVVVRLLADNRVELSVDGHTEQALTNGIASTMNADSNIYIGGIPDYLNLHNYPSLTGCIDQVEFMDTGRGVNLGTTAVTGRNTQLCKKY